MKRVTLGFSILAVAALFIVGCKKPKDNEVPVPDTEVQTSIDASWATFAITDVEQICSSIIESNLNNFYSAIPGVPGGTVTIFNDTLSKFIFMAFNKTNCLDGHLREGTVELKYGNFDAGEKAMVTRNQPDSKYARSYGFGGFITLSDYKVDGIKIVTQGFSKGYLINEILAPNYDASKVPLKWKFGGKFNFIHPTDSTKNMTWDGELIKTLTNSTNKDSVFKYTADHRNEGNIRWAAGKVTYSGKVLGTIGHISKPIPYVYVVPESTPLFRDYRCYSNKVGGVILTPTAGVINVRAEEFHPFISGVASLTTTNKEGVTLYPRTINYGSEGNLVEGVTSAQCDNVGDVYIKGISYRVDFRQ